MADARRSWVLRVVDNNDSDRTFARTFASEDAARQWLGGYVVEEWPEHFGPEAIDPPVPMPDDREDAIAQFFGDLYELDYTLDEVWE